MTCQDKRGLSFQVENPKQTEEKMCHRIKNQNGFFLSYSYRGAHTHNKYIIGLKEIIVARNHIRAVHMDSEYEVMGETELGIVLTNRKAIRMQPIMYGFQNVDGSYRFAKRWYIRAGIHVSQFEQRTPYKEEEEYEKRIRDVLSTYLPYSLPHPGKNGVDGDMAEWAQVYCLVDMSKIIFFDGESVSTSEFIVPKTGVIKDIIAGEIENLEDKKEEFEDLLTDSMEKYDKLYQKIEKAIS